MMLRFFYIITVLVFSLPSFAGKVPTLLAEKFIQSYTSPTGAKVTLQDLASFENLDIVGFSAQDIYQMTLSNGEPVILKDLKGYKYQPELDNLLKIEPFIAAYAEKATKDMPQFARYRGHFILEGGLSEDDQTTHHLILFDHAPGQSLFDWLEDFAPEDHSDAALSEIKTTFKKVGASIAQFHLANKIGNDDNFKTILHSDLHMGNVFLEVNPELRVTFIDYESVALTMSKPTIVNWDLQRLFQFSLPGLKGKVIETTKLNFMKYHYKGSIFLSQEDSSRRDVYIDTKLNQLNTFISSLAEGYDKEMRHHGWTLTKDRDDLVPVAPRSRATRGSTLEATTSR